MASGIESQLAGSPMLRNVFQSAGQMASHVDWVPPERFDEYQLAKYNGGQKAVKLRVNLPMNGGHSVKGVQSPWEVQQCHAHDAPTPPTP